MKQMFGMVAAGLLAAGLSGCAHTQTSSAQITDITLHQPMPGLYTAGQPSEADWKALRARGIRTVINLRTPQELEGRNEAAEVRAADMRYVEIPVAGADGINADNAMRLHAALQPGHGGGVLVHCASANRAGALLALEQKEYDGITPEAALTLGQQAGVTKMEPVLKKALGL